jgi:hypothetical protein
LPFREQTIAVMEHPTETIEDRPNEMTSRPTPTIENTKPTTA